MTPDILARDIEKMEASIAQLRAAVLDTQITSGKIQSLEQTISQFIARSEVIADKNEKSMVRLHERIDSLNSKVGEEISSMRDEIRNQHQDHRETVNSQIQTSVIALTAQVGALDKRLSDVKSETEGWINRGKGAWWSASLVWGVFGTAILGSVAWLFGEVRTMHEAIIVLKGMMGK
jgi:DNA anti-recombination protein RmuC